VSHAIYPEMSMPTPEDMRIWLIARSVRLSMTAQNTGQTPALIVKIR